MRYPTSEKLEIIRIVEQSHLPATRTLDQLGIARRTFYRWYDRFLEGGPEAMEARELVLASPELSLNQLGKREGRCRTQLGKLFRLSWLSPLIVEAILDGRQPARLDRRHLLEADLPLCWHEQERMLGFAA
jgi:transposase-like protein